MKITIGKEAGNDYTIDDPQVSRYHARLDKGQDGRWLLEDLGSTNGTFVNGSQVVKKHILPTDHIRLGGEYMLNIRDVIRSVNDYSDDFLLLEEVYNTYIEKKVKIQSSNQFKARLFQALPFALPGIIGVIVSVAGKGSPLIFGVSLFVAVCAPAIGIYFGAKQSAKVPRLLHDLSNQFKINYVCPKCGTFLGEIPWQSLVNKKQCPVSSCQAKWAKE